MTAHDEVLALRRMRDHFWNSTEWKRVPPPKDQRRRGEVRYAGGIQYANKATGEIE